MPHYELFCRDCKKAFLKTLTIARHEKEKIACPQCGSKNAFRLMAASDVLPGITRKRGNPNWGRLTRPAPAAPTTFEIEVRRLHLTAEQYVVSAELRRWCEENRNRCYIPEWLLDAWDIRVDADLSGAT